MWRRGWRARCSTCARPCPTFSSRRCSKRLDPTSLTMLAQVGRPWLAAVLASGLPRLPKWPRVRLVLGRLCPSAERLAWAKANGCMWGFSDSDWWNHPCALAARGGHLEALRWTREHDCPWDTWKCAHAARGGHLETLRWARQHDCAWDAWTCRLAALGGHLDVLQWARAHGCKWSKWDCFYASRLQPETHAWVQQQRE